MQLCIKGWENNELSIQYCQVVCKRQTVPSRLHYLISGRIYTFCKCCIVYLISLAWFPQCICLAQQISVGWRRWEHAQICENGQKLRLCHNSPISFVEVFERHFDIHAAFLDSTTKLLKQWFQIRHWYTFYKFPFCPFWYFSKRLCFQMCQLIDFINETLEERKKKKEKKTRCKLKISFIL